MEKVSPIILKTDDGKELTLEFSRESVKFAEARGFTLEDVDKYPMTKIPEFIYYSFRMHHKNIALDYAEKLVFEKFGGIGKLPKGFMQRLVDLYVQPFGTLTDDEDENEEEKNPLVTVTM